MTLGRGIAGGLVFVLALCLAAGRAERARPYNVVLITADSLRLKNLSCYGYAKSTSPFLDRLCREGVRFDAAFSQCSWTSPSLLSVVTGWYPPVHGVDGRNRNIAPGLTTPVHVLKKSGYAAPAISHIHTVLNYQNLGFDRVAEKTPEEWVERNAAGGPFFLWHHYYTTHLPYDAPNAERKIFFTWNWDELPRRLQKKLEIVRRDIIIRKGTFAITPSELPFFAALYDARVRQLDGQIKNLFAALQRAGVLENTLVIITADHGEEQLERGFIGHASTNLCGTLFDEAVHVPLIVWMPPKIRGGRRVGAMVETLDVMPTVFEVLGLADVAPRDGKSFAGLLEGKETKGREYCFSETRPGGYQVLEAEDPARMWSVRTAEWKLIRTYDGKEYSSALYHLADDPGEKTDVSGRFRDVERALLSRLGEWLAHCAEKRRRLEDSVRPGAARGAQSAYVEPGIRKPEEGQKMDFARDRACIEIAWNGADDRVYTVEYEIGCGDYAMKGSFETQGCGRVFGPFPEDLWKQFHLYNPWRFRVWDNERPEKKSGWREFGFES